MQVGNIPGNNPHSKRPSSNLNANNCPYVFTNPIQTWMIAHRITIAGIHRDGRNFLRTRLDGISKATYVTKKTVLAMLNWFCVMCSSLTIPASFAVPTFVRSRNERVKRTLWVRDREGSFPVSLSGLEGDSRHPWNKLLIQLPQQRLFPPRKLLGTHIPQLFLDRLVILIVWEWCRVMIRRCAIGGNEDRR